jgi:hypothetical protein
VDAVHLYVGMVVFFQHDQGQFRSMRVISEIVLGLKPSITTTLADGSDARISTCSKWNLFGEEDPRVLRMRACSLPALTLRCVSPR